MLLRIYLNFIHDLLHIGHMPGERFCFDFLLIGLDASSEDKCAVLCLVVDALLVEILVGLDGGFEVCFNALVEN